MAHRDWRPENCNFDGQRARDAYGLDVSEEDDGTVSQQRLYQLIRQRASIADRTLEIIFLAGSAEAYVLTFG